jgi:RNA polymerase sigma factor (sigma-70 family)
MMDTRTLVERARSGDPFARERLMDVTLPQVLRWCARMGGRGVDAEDAAHDALVVVITRLDTLQDPSRFDAWVYGIVRRTLAWHRRKAWLKRWLPGILPDNADPSPGPALVAEKSEVAEAVNGILEQLPADLREVLVLCDVEERSDDEAAAMIGIPSGTAKSRLRRARARFEEAARGLDLDDSRSMSSGEER